MKLTLTKFFSLVAALIIGVNVIHAQDNKNSKSDSAKAGAVVNASMSPVDLAKAAFVAHGGEKFKSLKNIVMRGTVNLYAPNSTNALPGQFVIATAGDKLRVEVAAPPVFAFKQVFDGQNFYSSIPNFELPQISKLGVNALARYDQPGYAVTAIPDKDKLRGFRITDGEGNATDFFIEPATARVKSFLIPFKGQTFGSENDKMKEVEGVLIPFKFTWRMETIQGVYFAEYSIKDVKLNQELGDDVFQIPN